MLKVRKQKIIKQSHQERQALKYLSLISEKDTGYLDDWSKTNQIKYNQLNQQVGGPQKGKPNLVGNLGATLTERRQVNTDGSDEKTLNGGREKKLMEVKVENFATIPHRASLLKIRKSELSLYKKNEIDSQFQAQAQNQMQNDDGNQRYRMESKLRQSASMNYIDKIRQLSLPWIKHFPREEKNQIPHLDEQMKMREQTRKLNDLIRNKIRRKQSNKFILQKQKLEEEQNEEKPQKNASISDSSGQKLGNIEDTIDSNEMKILRNWLDYNRSKRKRSITSLLNQHFQFKYLEKKKQRERAMALKSLKTISSLVPNNR